MYGDEEVAGVVLRRNGGGTPALDANSISTLARTLNIEKSRINTTGMRPGDIYIDLDPDEEDVDELLGKLRRSTTFGDLQVELDVEENSYTVPVEETNPSLISTNWAAIDDAASDPDHQIWHLNKTHLLEAASLYGKGRGVVVAQPDTGYTDHHETVDILYDLNRDYSFIRRQGNDARDPLGRLHLNQGHGTGSASVLASPANASTPLPAVGDVWGAAPEIGLLPLRCVRMVGRLTYFSCARAVRYAEENRADIIYFCLGGILKDSTFNGARELESAINSAVEQGIIVVAAAGNPPARSVVFPASMGNVIAVAASNYKDEPCEWSCRGTEVDISAPGEGIYRAKAKRRLKTTYRVAPSNGTTYACTLVAAAASIWLSHHGRAAVEKAAGGKPQVASLFKNLLLRTARPPLGWNKQLFGAGILDAMALLAEPLP